MAINLNAVLDAKLELQGHGADTDIGALSLRDALPLFAANGDGQADIPWRVKLLENPRSPVALPGNVDLHGHDCLHLLLSRGKSPPDEAFVIGFSMGNCSRTSWFHLLLFKLVTLFFYPQKWRFDSEHHKVFDLGVWYGSKVHTKNLTCLDFRCYEHQTICELRQEFGIQLQALQQIWQTEQLVSCGTHG